MWIAFYLTGARDIICKTHGNENVDYLETGVRKGRKERRKEETGRAVEARGLRKERKWKGRKREEKRE